MTFCVNILPQRLKKLSQLFKHKELSLGTEIPHVTFYKNNTQYDFRSTATHTMAHLWFSSGKLKHDLCCITMLPRIRTEGSIKLLRIWSTLCISKYLFPIISSLDLLNVLYVLKALKSFSVNMAEMKMFIKNCNSSS